MEAIKKIIYIGTGCHLDVVAHFPNVSEFVFVDTQPRSEFDSMEPNLDFYRDQFVNTLLSAGVERNIELIDVRELDTLYIQDKDNLPFLNPTLLTFMNNRTDQIIRYYISTNIRYNALRELADEIKQVDGLIVSGYYPDIALYDLLDERRPIHFIGYSRTCYTINIDDMMDTIYCKLHEKNTYFKDYYHVDYECGKITKYDTFKNFVSKEVITSS